LLLPLQKYGKNCLDAVRISAVKHNKTVPHGFYQKEAGIAPLSNAALAIL